MTFFSRLKAGDYKMFQKTTESAIDILFYQGYRWN